MVQLQTRIPTEALTYDFSYSRSKGKFRFRWEDGETLCNFIGGNAFIRGCDNKRGNIAMHCKLELDDGGVARLYRDVENEPPVYDYIGDITTLYPPREVSSSGTAFPESHNELDEHIQAGFLPSQLFDYDDMPETFPHARLCFHRAGENWRIRDEREGRLWLVDGYYGPITINWLDQGTHIFHDGKIEVGEDRIAHFVEG